MTPTKTLSAAPTQTAGREPGLPALRGTSPELATALSLRRERLQEIDSYLDELATMHHVDPRLLSGFATCRDLAVGTVDASWWLAHRHLPALELLRHVSSEHVSLRGFSA